VDPGSRLTGYGCVDRVGRQIRHVTHGTLRLSATVEGVPTSFEDRLLSIYQGLTEVILEFKPQVLSIEKVFFAKNAMSALKLGQARGAAILTGRIHALSIVEYSPTEVKRIVTGHGQSDKEQVAKMVQLLVGKRQFSTADASDGLALAICHALLQSGTLATSSLASSGLQSALSGRSKKKLSLAEAMGISLPKKI
jgi:crossover junction endodeoxyribonuclease RuvC